MYGDEFFDDLRQFLPHVERIKFLGGEPFLAAETLRVMELLVEMGLAPRCHVTTNGTQWSPRVERILAMLPVDSASVARRATVSTYESIRIGSSWDTVQRNLDRFQAQAEARGTDLTVTFCLMTSNWREFAAFCRAADERGIGCAVNVVAHGPRTSASTGCRRRRWPQQWWCAASTRWPPPKATCSPWSRATWDGELAKLRAVLPTMQAHEAVPGLDDRPMNPGTTPRSPGPRNCGAGIARHETGARGAALAAEHLGSEPATLQLDADGMTAWADLRVEALGSPVEGLAGVHAWSLVDILTEAMGPLDGLGTLTQEDDIGAYRVRFADGRVLQVVTVSDIADDGAITGITASLGWKP